MEHKTKVAAEEGRQDLTITREFGLPLGLLFTAFTERELIEQWMNTKVLTLDMRRHGSYRFETSTPQGNVAFQASGVIHELVPESKIIRTFEMENTPFGVQLEVYSFESLSDDTSRLTIHTIYESAAQRDQVLKLPFAMGINMAHNRLEEILTKRAG